MPTCIARKAMQATRATGTVEREGPFVGRPSMPNGSASLEACFGEASSLATEKSKAEDEEDAEIRHSLVKKMASGAGVPEGAKNYDIRVQAFIAQPDASRLYSLADEAAAMILYTHRPHNEVA